MKLPVLGCCLDGSVTTSHGGVNYTTEILSKESSMKVEDMVNIALKIMADSKNYDHHIHVHFAGMIWLKNYFEDICEHTCLAFQRWINALMTLLAFLLGECAE